MPVSIRARAPTTQVEIFERNTLETTSTLDLEKVFVEITRGLAGELGTAILSVSSGSCSRKARTVSRKIRTEMSMTTRSKII